MRLLMCHPDYYGIEYEINPWMHKEEITNHELAIQQWQKLYQTLTNCGAQIDLIKPIRGWPDMVFTANAGLYFQNKIILPHFKHKERQGELPYFRDWFTQEKFAIANSIPEKKSFFEGAGDALPAGNKLFAGYGFRSDRSFYEETDFFESSQLIYCELQDPYFYHIDTCFCPLNERLAIWYPQAFTQESQIRMAENIELIPVIESEAKHFACNAVVLDQHIILPNDCPQIASLLKKRGFTVHQCDMSEFLKAGGACKCLTLRID